MKVDVLGTEYRIEKHDLEEDGSLKGRFGYCDWQQKLIVIINLNTADDWKTEPDSSKLVQDKNNLRHEILHAFFYESGLHGSSLEVDQWALNEEMVDWFAIQAPKIFKAFQRANCLTEA